MGLNWLINTLELILILILIDFLTVDFTVGISIYDYHNILMYSIMFMVKYNDARKDAGRMPEGCRKDARKDAGRMPEGYEATELGNGTTPNGCRGWESVC